MAPLGKSPVSFVQIAPVLYRAVLWQKAAEIKRRRPRKRLSWYERFVQHSTFGDDYIASLLKVGGYDDEDDSWTIH